jgi:hypothetical protein
MQTQQLTIPQLQARVRSLQYRQRTMEPRRTAIRELMDKLEHYRAQNELVPANEYDVRSLPFLCLFPFNYCNSEYAHSVLQPCSGMFRVCTVLHSM